MVIFLCSNRERPYELYIFIASVAIVTSYCVVDFIVGLQEGLDKYPFQIKLVRVKTIVIEVSVRFHVSSTYHMILRIIWFSISYDSTYHLRIIWFSVSFTYPIRIVYVSYTCDINVSYDSPYHVTPVRAERPMFLWMHFFRPDWSYFWRWAFRTWSWRAALRGTFFEPGDLPATWCRRMMRSGLLSSILHYFSARTTGFLVWFFFLSS